MSLHAAVLRAKEAAAHAKPFMKLIDALAVLDTELRAAGQLETDAQAAVDKKAKFEADIPALESAAKAAQHTVNAFKAELTSKRNEFNKQLEDAGTEQEQKLKARCAQIEQEHQDKITGLKNVISTLGGTISSLEKQKSDIESQIGALRKTFEDARTALHA